MKFQIVMMCVFLSSTFAGNAGAHLLRGSVLFVEDNAGWGPLNHPDPLWHNTLVNLLGAGNFGWYGPTTGAAEDGPDLVTMQNNDLVIWNNYDHYEGSTLTENDILNISDYIDGGGKFWLIAQDAIHSGVSLFFLQTYFHLAGYVEDYFMGGVRTHIQGLTEVAGNPISLLEDYVWNDFNPDALTPDAYAHYIIKDTEWNQHPGILSNDSSTSFWAIDGRTPDPDSTWEKLVHDMLLVFVVIGIQESEKSRKPLARVLLMAAPSVFTQTTLITYTVPVHTEIAVTLHDALGRHIKTLVDGYHTQGSYTTRWDGTDMRGKPVQRGVYFCTVTSSTGSRTVPIVCID